MALYPFQEQAVLFHLAHHYSLNCSEMGTGKTRMALEAARRSGFKVAVFGPTFLKRTWEMEAKEVGISFKYFPYSTVHKVMPADVKGLDFWIVDECHYLKTPTTRRTHAFYSLIQGRLPTYFIGLTGTPIKNRVPDFWTLLAFCRLNPKGTSGAKLEGALTKYYSFARHFCHTEVMKVAGRRIEKFGGIREDKIPEFKGLLRDKFIRFRVDDVLKDLPEMTRKAVPLDLSPTPGLEEAFDQYFRGRKVDVTAKAMSALLKAPATVDYCKEIYEGGSGPLIIFTDHIESAKAIQKGFGGVLITGQTPMQDRQDAVADFQAGRHKAIVATIGSMSVGVTLTAARHVVFNDLSWVPADNLQAEKRIHRIGQKGACFAHYIDATPTDAYIRKTLFGKLETISKVVG